MNHTYFIGVDGGGSKTRVRLENLDGNVLGENVAGPSNVNLPGGQAWQSVYAALNPLLAQHHLTLQDPQSQFYACMGLAGCEVAEARQAFLDTPHPFAQLSVVSDAETACVGAHGPHGGAIIIAGTGVVGFKRMQDVQKRVGGHGFPHDDEGGGAWLGLQAVRVTLQWLDGRLPLSGLAEAIHAHFHHTQGQLVTFANRANASAFAELAPLVAMAATAGDITAVSLLKQAARCVERIAYGLDETLTTPLALIGGIIPHIARYLSPRLLAARQEAKASPQAGAIQLLREQLSREQLSPEKETHAEQALIP